MNKKGTWCNWETISTWKRSNLSPSGGRKVEHLFIYLLSIVMYVSKVSTDCIVLGAGGVGWGVNMSWKTLQILNMTSLNKKTEEQSLTFLNLSLSLCRIVHFSKKWHLFPPFKSQILSTSSDFGSRLVVLCWCLWLLLLTRSCGSSPSVDWTVMSCRSDKLADRVSAVHSAPAAAVSHHVSVDATQPFASGAFPLLWRPVWQPADPCEEVFWPPYRQQLMCFWLFSCYWWFLSLQTPLARQVCVHVCVCLHVKASFRSRRPAYRLNVFFRFTTFDKYFNSQPWVTNSKWKSVM